MRGENDPAATAKAIIDANLYMVLGTADAATAEEVTGNARVAVIDTFSRRTLGHGGGREWTLEDVEPPAEIRLYRATASAHYILGAIDRLVAVDLLR